MSIIDFVYEPLNKFRAPRNPNKCAYQVGDDEHLTTHFRQCSRKIVVRIDGFGFCRQHAQMIQTRLTPKP